MSTTAGVGKVFTTARGGLGSPFALLLSLLFHPTVKSWGKGGEQEKKEREACPHHWAVSALRGQRTKVPEEQGSDVGHLC